MSNEVMENEEKEKLLNLAEEKKYRQLKEALLEINEVDIASFMEELDSEKTVIVFRMLPKALATDVFAELPAESQSHIINSITDKELSEIVEDLYVDDAVDMLEELPATVVRRVLKNTTPDTRKLINQFLNYPENSAGSIMTAEYVGLKKNMTVEQSFAYIRHHGVDSETIYTCYVMDEKRHLEGVVTVKELLMNAYETRLETIMDTHVIKVTTTEDQEAVADMMNRYGLLCIPVVDSEDRLVGIITVDDVMEVMEEEATEDFEKMAAMAPSEKPYLKTGVFSLARHRIVWLLVLMISGMITGGILGRYEAAIAAMPLLVTFIPMLTDTGGNAGSQSSTLVIRGLAVNEITLRDFPRVLWKELRVSLLVGVVLSAVNFVRLILTYPGSEMVALTVALTMLCTVIVAKTIGGVLPLIAKACRMDPAIMASPLITTIVDAVSLVIYFAVAHRLLPL